MWCRESFILPEVRISEGGVVTNAHLTDEAMSVAQNSFTQSPVKTEPEYQTEPPVKAEPEDQAVRGPGEVEVNVGLTTSQHSSCEYNTSTHTRPSQT